MHFNIERNFFQFFCKEFFRERSNNKGKLNEGDSMNIENIRFNSPDGDDPPPEPPPKPGGNDG